ncbi:MAG: hypothetical protein J1F66_03520 [Clostridiales bacterium]|nr:hypothetical protein [Clostridiales bacterium]
MKIRETKLGKEFIFDNQFSKNRLSKNDRKLTKWLRFKYKFCKTFKLVKFVKNKSWYSLADYHWNTIFDDPTITGEKQVELTKNEIELKRIVIYDLLPKEYLEMFRDKYCKFRLAFMSKHYTNRKRIEIVNHLEGVHHPYNFYMNLEYFNIKEGTTLKHYFDDLHVEIVGLTESFCIIKYSLNVSSNAVNLFEQITSQKVYKSPLCWSNDAWWKRHSIAGFTCYDSLNQPKKYVVEDFLLELKSVFFKEIRNKLFSKFYDWKIIPPSVVVFSSNNLEESKEKIFNLFFNAQNSDYNKTKQVYFIPDSQQIRSNGSSSVLIADESNFTQSHHGRPDFEETDDQICSSFSSYFVLESLDTAITNAINIAERDISQTVNSKSRYRKLLNIKTKTDKNLYFYKRLLSELDEEKTLDGLNEDITYYQETYEYTQQERREQYGFGDDFDFKLRYTFSNCKNKLLRIEKIYKHFDENVKIIESKYNYKIVVFTLVVGFLTLVATVLVANDSYVFKWICNIIKDIFS